MPAPQPTTRTSLTASSKPHARFLPLGFLILAGLPAFTAPPEASRPLGRIVVGTAQPMDPRQFQSLSEPHQARVVREISALGMRVLEVATEDVDRVITSLRENPHIAFAEPDLLLPPATLPNDPYYGNQWFLPVVGAPTAWDLGFGSPEVVIAILDTGLDSTHPEFAGNLVAGWNFYDNNADTSDVQGHGTAVAGVAGALAGNGTGIAGIASGCRIMPIRVTDPYGSGVVSAMAEGLVFAADHGARVANLSFPVSSSFTLRAAAEYFQGRGGVITVGAGNQSYFDATSDNPFVLTVTATTAQDTLATWSNTGNNVDLAAPGESILSTATGNQYAWNTGTSVSAPMVAGAAALVMSINPGLSGTVVQQVLKDTATDLGTAGWDPGFGWGRLDVASAVATARALGADTLPPTASVVSPTALTTLSGTVNVVVAATDNAWLTRVELLIDGSVVSVSSTAPSNYAWNTVQASNGSHQLLARSYDASGNWASSESVPVNVSNNTADLIPPTAVVGSPAPGTKVARKQKVVVESTDNVGVVRVDLLVDGKVYASADTARATFTWDTTAAARGVHTLQAVAVDAAGNRGSSSLVSVSK